MSSPRPIIGVTGPDRGGTAAWIFTSLAVRSAGGIPVRLTPRRSYAIERLDGLILGGGADIQPELYGSERIPFFPTVKPRGESITQFLLGLVIFPLTYLSRRLDSAMTAAKIDASRDVLEMTLLARAVRRQIPVLGICRGEQLINVYFGGSLHQHLTGFYVEEPEVRTILPRRRISVTEGTRLAQIIGETPRPVNALHRQAVNTLGRELLVAAKDRNGIIQAIEHQSLPFVVGVQWHPEFLPQVKEQKMLFKCLIDEAQKARARAHVQPDTPKVARTASG